MAQLRTAVRAYALEGHDPDEVIELVDRFLQSLEPDGYATCCYVELEPVSGALRWCNAGHPDPLVLTRHGCAAALTEHGHRPALGVPSPTPTPAPGRGVLPPGARLLLFTDGLVERRRESLDLGLERLARSATAFGASGADLQPWCDEVVAALLGDREVGDDVAVLAVEVAVSELPGALAGEQRPSKVAG
jgi:serine phosphatase RsbU (regulator of sigma subunit)